MSNEENLVPDIWNILKEYIPSKDQTTAAEHLATALIEFGVDDNFIKELAECDDQMADVIAELYQEDSDDDELYD